MARQKFNWQAARLLETDGYVASVPGPTSLQLRIIVKGPSAGLDYYDNISVTVTPEPSLIGLASALAYGVLGFRRVR